MTRTKVRATRAAEQLLEQAGIADPPVPVERLARRLGADLRYESFEGELSGLLFREAGRTIIGVNALHGTTRQRFTIAHELGHLLLHEHEQLHVDRDFRLRRRDERSSQAVDPGEIAANSFAAALLMPAFMLRRDLVDHAVDLEGDDEVRRLAERYQVSLQAIIFRLTNLGLLEP